MTQLAKDPAAANAAARAAGTGLADSIITRQEKHETDWVGA